MFSKKYKKKKIIFDQSTTRAFHTFSNTNDKIFKENDLITYYKYFKIKLASQNCIGKKRSGDDIWDYQDYIDQKYNVLIDDYDSIIKKLECNCLFNK